MNHEEFKKLKFQFQIFFGKVYIKLAKSFEETF